MLYYLLQTMLRRSARNIVLIIGLLALSSGLSTYAAVDQQATAQVKATMDEHWRGTYDILVRPAAAIQSTEKTYGVVEANYLSAGRGGITVQQWKDIERLPGVDIAAPVATIGYLRNTVGRMALEMPPQTEPSAYRFSLALTSTNGFRTVSYYTSTKYLLLGPPTLPNPTTDAEVRQVYNDVNLLSANDATVYSDGSGTFLLLTPPVVWTLVAAIDPAAERRLSGLDSAIIERRYLADNDGLTTQKVPAPNSIPGEDPFDRSQDNRNRNKNRSGPDLPIIHLANTYTALPAEAVITRHPMIDAPTLAQLRAAMDGAIIEASTPGTPLFGTTRDVADDAATLFLDRLQLPVIQTPAHLLFDLGTILRPMSLRPFSLNLHPGQPLLQTDPSTYLSEIKGIEKAYLPNAVTYQPYKAPFDSEGRVVLAAVPKPDAQTIISLTGEVAFRSLAPTLPVMANPGWDNPSNGNNPSPYSFHETGTYDLNQLPEAIRHPDPLTYVPLGIYQPPLVTLVRDAAGTPLPAGPVPLHPTLNPASFIPGPPLALTNIAAARFFRGEACIDAIRVRVAGIDRYTPANIKKVEEVAAAIARQPDLQVDIVAGSSPQTVLVYVPGTPDGSVAPLGYVEEPWTTLGAAARIVGGFDRTGAILLAGLVVAGVLYLLNQAFLLSLARRKELALLGALGWRRRQITTLVLGEAAILGALGGPCAVGCTLLITQVLNLPTVPVQMAVIGGSVLALYLLTALYPAQWIVRQPVADLLRRGEVAPAAGSVRPGRFPARRRAAIRARPPSPALELFLLAGRNLRRRPTRTALTASGVSIGMMLLLLMGAALFALGGTLRVTLLGQFISIQLQPYHYLMVGSALVLSLLAVADHLAVGVLERRPELALLQALGWRAGTVRLSLLLEGCWLGLLGSVPGAALLAGLGLLLGSPLVSQLWWLIPLGLVTMILLCTLAASYAIRLTPRQTLIRAVQE